MITNRLNLTFILSICLILLLSFSDKNVEMEEEFSPELKNKLIESVQNNFEKLGVPGIIVGLWIPSKGSWRTTLGVSNRETNDPINYDQHVRIGSITKTFTVTLILLLAEEGKLSLDDTVDQYLEGVPNGDKITIRNLANLTSGLANYTFDPKFQDELFKSPSSPWDPSQLVEIGYRNTKLGCPNAPTACFEAGKSWFYSNTNIVMLGLIVEKVTGKKYEDVLKENIIIPLGLNNTSHPTSANIPTPFAHGYTTQGLPEGSKGVQDSTTWNPSWGWAVGDMISTFDDLHKWGRALGKGTLLSKGMQSERLKKVTVGPNTPDHAYALGIGFKNGWWGHGGELPGYNSATYYRPDIDAVIVVITNSDLVEIDGEEVHPSYIVADSIMDIINRNYPSQ